MPRHGGCGSVDLTTRYTRPKSEIGLFGCSEALTSQFRSAPLSKQHALPLVYRHWSPSHRRAYQETATLALQEASALIPKAIPCGSGWRPLPESRYPLSGLRAEGRTCLEILRMPRRPQNLRDAHLTPPADKTHGPTRCSTCKKMPPLHRVEKSHAGPDRIPYIRLRPTKARWLKPLLSHSLYLK